MFYSEIKTNLFVFLMSHVCFPVEISNVLFIDVQNVMGFLYLLVVASGED